tara:strand:- start:587 stop:787 length:201 start_codon:yes stop_codon:yes gene_type:complete
MGRIKIASAGICIKTSLVQGNYGMSFKKDQKNTPKCGVFKLNAYFVKLVYSGMPNSSQQPSKARLE